MQSSRGEWHVEYDDSIYAIRIEPYKWIGVHMELTLRNVTPEDLRELSVMFRKAYQEELKRGISAR